MIETIERETRSQPRARAMVSPWRWAWLLMLATWVIVAHGCHGGDHDDELSLPDDPTTYQAPS